MEKVIYQNVISIAEKKGITINELEKRAELSHGTIRKWKKSRPTITTLAKVADKLGVSISTLLKGVKA